MTQTAIQLYSLRALSDSLPDLVRRVSDTSFDGVELAGLGSARPADVTAALDETGLDVAGAHVGLEQFEEAFSETVSTYQEVDAGTLVVPYLDDSHFESERAVEQTANRLTDLAERLAEHGLGLCYHNHDHEFVEVGDQTAFDLLVEKTDDRVGFELDVGWVAAAGRDPAALLSRLGERVPIVHLKDVDTATRTPVELGDGDLDVEGCARAAHNADVEWLVYEHDDPTNPAKSLEYGAALLDSLRA